MEEPPPPYSATDQGNINTKRTTTRRFSRSNAVRLFNSRVHHHAPRHSKSSSSHRFPREFGLYHALESATDYVISFHANDPNALFYISTHASTSHHPSLVLHSIPHPAAPPLATATLHFVSETVAINIYDSPTSLIKAQGAETSNSCMMFIVQLPGTTSKTPFSWQMHHSWGRELSRLDGWGSGMRLVNCNTKETVAVWTTPSLSTKKLGKMKFVAENRSKLGERFELMAVITLLSIIEKEKEKGRGDI